MVISMCGNKVAIQVKKAQAIIALYRSQEELAHRLGIKQPSISKWLKEGLPDNRELYFREIHPKLSIWREFPRAR